ncbi:hypothetical protein F5Y17DRAFT_462681 [Xylariaceae sp. FL0594]|nr:hypothetical protein F5Y17DRAFT_462681 [Xylariaceae sp. FL0594]
MEHTRHFQFGSEPWNDIKTDREVFQTAIKRLSSDIAAFRGAQLLASQRSRDAEDAQSSAAENFRRRRQEQESLPERIRLLESQLRKSQDEVTVLEDWLETRNCLLVEYQAEIEQQKAKSKELQKSLLVEKKQRDMAILSASQEQQLETPRKRATLRRASSHSQEAAARPSGEMARANDPWRSTLSKMTSTFSTFWPIFDESLTPTRVLAELVKLSHEDIADYLTEFVSEAPEGAWYCYEKVAKGDLTSPRPW